jgi:hypothetical protein
MRALASPELAETISADYTDYEDSEKQMKSAETSMLTPFREVLYGLFLTSSSV